jgi:glycerol-3-phosphate dehydrogenase
VNQPGVAESSITRRHVLYDHASRDGVDGLWTLQGGKITTARSLAELCVDRITRFVGRPELRKVHPTRSRAYPGGGMPAREWDAWRANATQAAIALGIRPESAAALVQTYGSKWREVATCDDRAGARQPLANGRPHLGCQVTYAVKHEQARHLTDVVLRRTDLGIGPGGQEAAQAALRWMTLLCGWEGQRAEAEWQAYVDESALFAVPGSRTAAAEVAVGTA